jgi:hypothetical protein
LISFQGTSLQPRPINGGEVFSEGAYFDLNGKLIITESEINSGEATLNFDNQYDGDIIVYAENMSQSMINLVIASDAYKSNELNSWLLVGGYAAE